MGVTVPEAYNYDRPVPKGQSAVPAYQVPNAPEAPQLTNADAQAASSAAQQFTKVGGELEKWGDRLDIAQAQDAVNQLRNKRADLTMGDDGFLKVRGGDVLKKGPDGETIFKTYPQRFQQQVDDIGGKLLSPRAREIYNSRASIELMGYKADVAKHGLSESEKYEASVFKNTQVSLQNRGAQSADDPKALETYAEQAYQSTLARSKTLGIEGEEMAKGARSDVIRMALERKIQSGDESAIGLYERFKDKLDAKDGGAIEQAIKTLRVSATSRAYVGDITAPQAKRVNSSITHWEADGYGTHVAAGITAGFLRESGFRTEANNPKDGRDGSDSINIGQWNAARAKAFKQYAGENNLNEHDPKTGLLYAKAEIDGVIPYSVTGLSPDFKARLQNAKSEKEAADIMTRGYFRPKYQDGESTIRQEMATKILADYRKTGDRSLEVAVNGSDPSVPREGGPQYFDGKRRLIELDAEQARLLAQNSTDWAGNENMRAANESRLKVRYEQQKAEVGRQQAVIDYNVDQWMREAPDGKKRTDRPPPQIWDQLSYEKQKSIDATLAHNAKGTDAITDQQTWYEIQRGLSSEDPAERARWAAKPLWEYKSKLSNQDFQELAKLQGTARKGDPDKELTHVRNINQMVDDTLNRMKVDPTPKPGSTDAERAAKFRRAVQERLTVVEKDMGKKATTEQQQKVIDSLAIEVGGTGGLFSRNKHRYDMTIGDVPTAEKSKITEALNRAGVPVTDDAVIDLFARKNAKPAR